MSQEEIENLNRPMTSNEIELIIKNKQMKKFKKTKNKSRARQIHRGIIPNI